LQAGKAVPAITAKAIVHRNFRHEMRSANLI
jgi:hypothetical protein